MLLPCKDYLLTDIPYFQQQLDHYYFLPLFSEANHSEGLYNNES